MILFLPASLRYNESLLAFSFYQPATHFATSPSCVCVSAKWTEVTVACFIRRFYRSPAPLHPLRLITCHL